MFLTPQYLQPSSMVSDNFIVARESRAVDRILVFRESLSCITMHTEDSISEQDSTFPGCRGQQIPNRFRVNDQLLVHA